MYNRVEMVNKQIDYEINKNSLRSSYPTLENCLFGAVNLAKNADIDKYNYFGYRIGFDRQGNMVIDLVEIA